MASEPTLLLWIEERPGPPPPLAGALAAWWAAEGRSYRVRRGGTPEPGAWVHLEGDASADVVERLDARAAYRVFGPGLERATLRGALREVPGARLVRGDPEAAVRGAAVDPAELPITTWAGFPATDGARRVLAGRGDRARPLGRVVREVVYLVETWRTGHLLFDDEDLAAYGPWWAAFAQELARLPWSLSWEGTFSGERRRGRSR